MKFLEYITEKTNFLIQAKLTALDFVSNPLSLLGNASSGFLGFMKSDINFTVIGSAAVLIATVAGRLLSLYITFRKYNAEEERNRIAHDAEERRKDEERKAAEKRKDEKHQAELEREKIDFDNKEKREQEEFEIKKN